MLKRLFALTTLFSIYIFPASAGANINPIELNYETSGMPKEEFKNSSKNISNDLISKNTAKIDPKKKGNSLLNFLGLLLLSYALIEMAEESNSDSSSSNTTTTKTPELELF